MQFSNYVTSTGNSSHADPPGTGVGLLAGTANHGVGEASADETGNLEDE